MYKIITLLVEKECVCNICFITPLVEKECVSNICFFFGQNKNLVEVKDDSISGGEVCIRVDYLAVAGLFADHHLIIQFDRTGKNCVKVSSPDQASLPWISFRISVSFHVPGGWLMYVPGFDVPGESSFDVPGWFLSLIHI